MTPVSLGAAIALTALGTFALMIKLMIFALAIDDWWEVRSLAGPNPAKMVARDEVVASAGRVISVFISVLIGVVWMITILVTHENVPLVIAIVGGLLLQALLSDVQGIRALLHRRALSRALERTRRPTGAPMRDSEAKC